MKPRCRTLLLVLSLGALACAGWAASQGRVRPDPAGRGDDDASISSLLDWFGQEEAELAPGAELTPRVVLVSEGGGSMAVSDESAAYIRRGGIGLLSGSDWSTDDERRFHAARSGALELREFSATPWAEVFRWLAEQTGLPVTCPDTPPGSFTLPPSRRRCG